jgi:twitching motility protein PilJ
MALKLPGLKVPFSLPKGGDKAAGKGKSASGLDGTHTTTSILDSVQRMQKQKLPRRLPVIGHLPIRKQYTILLSGLVIFIMLAVAFTYLYTRDASYKAANVSIATEMQMLSQRLAKGAALAVQSGNAYGFLQLQESKDKFRTDLDVLTKGGVRSELVLPAPSETDILAVLESLNTMWDSTEKNATLILTYQENLSALARGVSRINSISTTFLDLSEEVAELVSRQSGVSAREVTMITQQVMLTQRMTKNANSLLFSEDIDEALLFGEEIDPQTAFLLGRDINIYRDVLQGMVAGNDTLKLSAVTDPDAKERLVELQKVFKDYEAQVNTILQNIQKLVAAKRAGRSINVDSESLLLNSRKLVDKYEEVGEQQANIILLIFGCGTFALGALVLLGFAVYGNARFQAFESEQENKRNQEAILRLLNEMGDLADGDLTVQASVTEDVTGAIADSINYTIDELRSLVKEINKATDQVAKASQEAQNISSRLLEAAQRQSREIQETSSSILQMAQSINEVSANAAESARVAQMSLNAAEKGATAVQNSIAGMNEIREQIQETSKRIKRLGESSLEISEIVELISDITEQTNVLALNAAIQAASAGEAGRGFTVVAEEVQRLAERSGEATKQIGAIVKTIQTDTQDAVAAMDKSTQGVVEGAKLSDAAGQALNEIGRVSQNLAGLIQTISMATQTQAESAGKITKGMQDILQITKETTEGTKQTAVSIGQLADLAAELRGSVAGFKVS